MKAYSHGPAAGGKPDSLVIFLHGYGSNGQDLISLAPYWERALPHTAFVSPDAPFPCEIGFGYQWFPLSDISVTSRTEGVKGAAPFLNRFVEEQMAKYNVSASKVALVGFSQGTMMSLYAAPRRAEALAGVIGYSGALLAGDELATLPLIAKLPILLIHGDSDPVVPLEAYHHAMATLQNLGFTDLSGSVTPGLAHSIDEQGLIDGLAFLQRVFS